MQPPSSNTLRRYDLVFRNDEDVLCFRNMYSSVQYITGHSNIHDCNGIYLPTYCPAERLIPIYLVVFGVFSTVIGILRMMTDCCKSEDSKASVAVVIVYVISLIVGPFITAWFIAGNVWIYRLNGKYSTDPTDPSYCNSTLYLYAFWLTTSLYILSGVCCVFLLIAGCVILWRKL